jgi:four helix bundle protein
MSGTYADLDVWQAAMELVVVIYQLTRRFPKDEVYGLVSQLRRVAVSVPSNIAEGKGRASDKELVQLLCHARGSLFEVETQLNIAERLTYIGRAEGESIRHELARIGQMLNGLIRSVRPAA